MRDVGDTPREEISQNPVTSVGQRSIQFRDALSSWSVLKTYVGDRRRVRGSLKPFRGSSGGASTQAASLRSSMEEGLGRSCRELDVRDKIHAASQTFCKERRKRLRGVDVRRMW